MQEAVPRPNETSRKSHSVTTLKYPLPNRDISFERHFEILKAYVAASKDGREPVSYNDFAGLTVSPTHVSANNKFFEHLGLISRVEGTAGKYLPTQTAIEISKDLAWKREENVKSKVATLVSKSWFGESARTLLAIRDKVTENELLEKFGYDSGADPVKHTSALKVLLQYLEYAGLVRVQEGFLTAHEESRPSSGSDLPEESLSNQTNPHVPIERARTTPIESSGFVLGILITPDMSEEQIRNTIRIVREEIQKK